MLGALEEKAAQAGRRAAFGLGAGLCLAVGAGFLTVAAWIALVAIASGLTAAVVIGCVYLGVGAIFLAFAVARSPSSHHSAAGPAPDVKTDAPPLMAAFVHGMNAGAQAVRR